MTRTKAKQDAQTKADLSGENQVVYSYPTRNEGWYALAHDYTEAELFKSNRCLCKPLPTTITTVKPQRSNQKK